jgi:hypothetical protein
MISEEPEDRDLEFWLVAEKELYDERNAAELVERADKQ